MIERTVYRTQKAEYAGGSRAKGFYDFTLQGIERTNKISTQNMEIVGRGATSQEATQNAWKAAREWVAENGEVVKTDSEYKSVKES